MVSENKRLITNEIDDLKIYFGYDYQYKDFIIKQPALKDILEYGERDFYNTLCRFCATPNDVKYELHLSGRKWYDVDEFENWIEMVISIDAESRTNILKAHDRIKEIYDIMISMANDFDSGARDVSEEVLNIQIKIMEGEIEKILTNTSSQNKSKLSIFFEGLDLLYFYPDKNTEGETIFKDSKSDMIITREDYLEITNYVRKIFGLKKNTKRSRNALARKLALEKAKSEYEKAIENKDAPFESNLRPVISWLVNDSNFKYNEQEILEKPIGFITDSINRIQVKKNSQNLINGLYANGIDGKKINQKELDDLRKI